MTRALADVGRAELLQTAGIFDDGWCEPVTRLTAKALAPLSHFQLTVWLKPEMNRERASLRISVNGALSLATDVTFDLPTVIQTSCPAGAGETLTVEISCDNEVHNKGSDLRSLGFLVSAIHFS